MKTYLFPHSLTAVLPTRQLLKRIFACALTMGASLILLANSAPYNITVDTNRVSSIGSLPIKLTSQVAGTVGNDEFSLPLVMTAFKIMLNDGRVVLSWTTGIEKRLSQFVVERSTDGINYQEAGLIFAVTNSSVKQNYSFTDAIGKFGRGLLYYRIRIVDANGKHQNSAVKLIRVGDDENITKVETYPNPVVNEVRITVPQSWQNQQVRYEVYNSMGRLVKRMVTANASQTEVLNMQDCNSGMYVIRASTITEAQSQSIVKK